MKRVCRIALEPPGQPEVAQLIAELDAYQRPLYPPESHHGIDMDALAQPNVLFAVARDETGEAVGCGAIVLAAEVGAQVGEVKRMFVRPQHRGRGVGRALLEFLETEAQASGCARFVLETGFRQHEALALYTRAGYERCAPFGDYTNDPESVFMEKRS